MLPAREKPHVQACPLRAAGPCERLHALEVEECGTQFHLCVTPRAVGHVVVGRRIKGKKRSRRSHLTGDPITSEQLKVQV